MPVDLPLLPFRSGVDFEFPMLEGGVGFYLAAVFFTKRSNKNQPCPRQRASSNAEGVAIHVHVHVHVVCGYGRIN